MSDITTVLDRVHAINGTLSVTNSAGQAINVRTSRYYRFPTSVAELPLVCCVSGQSAYSTEFGNSDDYTFVREASTIVIFVFCLNYFSDANNTIAQQLAEKLQTAIKRTYWARPRLELVGGDPLDCLVANATLSAKVGSAEINKDVLEFTFTLTVPYEDKIDRI